MKCRCGKPVGYKDRVAALYALARIQYKDKPGHNEKRVYRCDYGKFHLTSK